SFILFRDCFFFFFQAEDGIRYFHVTGVQTCALPIYERPAASAICRVVTLVPYSATSGRVAAMREARRSSGGKGRARECGRRSIRSEERRVGKRAGCGSTTQI